jgi:methylmalonyl-CoA mutase cobalamin-binding domain/chain
MKANTLTGPAGGSSLRARPNPVRILTAVPICDGHDSSIITVNLELVHHGVEVIYLGYHRSVRDIVRAAIQEDVRGIGFSSYNGGHVEFVSDVLRGLRRAGAGDIGIFGGGGGTITSADAKLMKRRGVDEIFFAGTPLAEIVKFVKERYAGPRGANPTKGGTKRESTDLVLARTLTVAGSAAKGVPLDGATNLARRKGRASLSRRAADVASEQGFRRDCVIAARRDGLALPLRPAGWTIGVTGPGGAGKTTLIDELVLRFLRARPGGRLAILSHDPSLVGAGALLGDRATMNYSQDDRVFMRSLSTRGQAGGLSLATARCLEILRSGGFDLVIVETVGVGQEALPFVGKLVDKTVFVMSPDYGSRLQLQKIAMLDVTDVVVVNKSDLPGAKTAAAEIEQRLARNQRGQSLISTVAKRHGDAGVDRLFQEVMS